MSSQIGAEYALGGHDVAFVARHPGDAANRIERAFALAKTHGLFPPDLIAAACRRVDVVAESRNVSLPVDLGVEFVVEDLNDKLAVLRPAAELMPDAILATNTSSLSISALGGLAGAPTRTIATHYWNPPLLMPLVEVIRAARTADRVVTAVTAELRHLGKRPVLVERIVPGFVRYRAFLDA